MCCQNTIRNCHAAITVQYDLGVSAAKHKSIAPAAAAARNLDAAIRLRSADSELQSTVELPLHKLQLFPPPKPDLDAKAEKQRF